jgi:hypothetical protein
MDDIPNLEISGINLTSVSPGHRLANLQRIIDFDAEALAT